ncbi:molybdopterin dehydrogenase [Actinosynnema sp. ALI-1.44]|uniref:FAD binding domain-containing protein n=1 Tax=Actinosynnema sp. ALI-1.44 TaxID=1933779 RepID=UPI00097C272C|nr:xanthine dehydrogenase family protein subunit M [Actinosynnema sp. ALI-1.44]ONI76106.1 molybdopterin dehydrogenase [Actinosynnema sp. ALI-1.44]
MKAAAFEYLRAASCDEAVAALAGEDTAVLAGGQSLVPLLNMRLARPRLVVDINRLADLSYLRRDNGNVVIGALTRHRAAETSAMVATDLPLLAAALRYVGHVSTRNRGTVGGSLAHADPSAELPTVAVALDASIRVQGSHGVRDIAAPDFFVGPHETALAPGELLVSVSFPVVPGAVSVQELPFRGCDLVVVAAVAVEDGICAQARIAVGGAGPTPIRASAVEEALIGRPVTDAVIAAAVAEFTCDPPDSLHAPASYRREMASVLTRRAIGTAVHT